MEVIIGAIMTILAGVGFGYLCISLTAWYKERKVSKRKPITVKYETRVRDNIYFLKNDSVKNEREIHKRLFIELFDKSETFAEIDKLDDDYIIIKTEINFYLED